MLPMPTKRFILTVNYFLLFIHNIFNRKCDTTALWEKYEIFANDIPWQKSEKIDIILRRLQQLKPPNCWSTRRILATGAHLANNEIDMFYT